MRARSAKLSASMEDSDTGLEDSYSSETDLEGSESPRQRTTRLARHRGLLRYRTSSTDEQKERRRQEVGERKSIMVRKCDSSDRNPTCT